MIIGCVNIMFNFACKNGISKITLHFHFIYKRNLISTHNSNQLFIHKITKDSFSNYSTWIPTIRIQIQKDIHQDSKYRPSLQTKSPSIHDIYKLDYSVIKHFLSSLNENEILNEQEAFIESKEETKSNDDKYINHPHEQIPSEYIFSTSSEDIVADNEAFIEPNEIKEESKKERDTNEIKDVMQLPSLEILDRRKRRLKEVFVRRDTDVRGLAGSICWRLREKNGCTILASGDMAVNQAMKGITLARAYFKQRREADLCFQSYHTYRHDRNTSNQMSFKLYKLDYAFTTTNIPEKIKVKGDGDPIKLSKSIKVSIEKNTYCELQALGPVAVAKAMIAFTWARRYSLAENKDLETASEFKSIDNPNNDDGKASMLCFTIRPKFLQNYITDEDERFAIDRMSFQKFDDKTLSEIFNGIGDLDLPIVKIAGTTHPNKASGTILTHLRENGGAQLFTTGTEAINQCIKALSVCRNCVMEQSDVDLAFKCMHAPKENNNGNCQLVAWTHIVPYDDNLKTLLQSDSSIFRVSITSDAKIIGTAMAARSSMSQKIECLATGKHAVSRAVVAISHARLLIAKDNLDLIVFPKFENVDLAGDDGNKSIVRLKLEVIFIEKIEN